MYPGGGQPPPYGANPWGQHPGYTGGTTAPNVFGAPPPGQQYPGDTGQQYPGDARQPAQQQHFTPAATPSPYNNMPPAGGGQKKALIIGCNYPGTQSQLRGCINDAQCMDYMLKTKFGFRAENIRLLRDDQRDPYFIPTRMNIMNWCVWHISGDK